MGAAKKSLGERFVRGLGAQKEIVIDERGRSMSKVVKQVVDRDPNV